MTLKTQPVASDPIGEWMGRHGPELRRHLTGMLGGADDADDVLQHVWMAAFRRPPIDGAGSNVRAWLYRVATNAALSHLAKQSRRDTALNQQRFKLKPETGPAPDDRLQSMSEKGQARVRTHLTQLPRKQREAVWLRSVADADYAEIARRLNCSEESARANVHNGLKRLRNELLDFWRKEYTE